MAELTTQYGNKSIFLYNYPRSNPCLLWMDKGKNGISVRHYVKIVRDEERTG